MRVITLIGILLIALGGYVLVNGLVVTRNKTVIDVGPIEASVKEKRAIPPWAGAVVGGLGIAMVVAGARRRTA